MRRLAGRPAGLWLAAIAGLLALVLNAGALRAAWLGNLGYIGLDELLSQPAAANGGAPDDWFQQAQAAQPRFEAAYGLGLADLARGRSAQAVADFQAALAADPTSKDAASALGDAYHASGDDAAAVSQWQAAQAAPLLMNRGLVQAQANNWPAGAEWYRLATEVDPTSAEAWNQLGSAEAHLGLLQQAVNALERAVSLAPDEPRYWHDLGLFYMSQGSAQAAADQFARVLALTPGDFYTNLYMASVQLQLGQLDAAETYARKAMQLNDRHPRPYYVIGRVEAQRGQWGQAAAAFEQAVARVAPWNAQAATTQVGQAETVDYRLWLARAYQSSGQAQPAIAAYQAVLALDPHNAAALAALEALSAAGNP